MQTNSWPSSLLYHECQLSKAAVLTITTVKTLTADRLGRCMSTSTCLGYDTYSENASAASQTHVGVRGIDTLPAERSIFCIAYHTWTLRMMYNVQYHALVRRQLLAYTVQVACLNEANAGSAKHVFRAWPERHQDPATPLDSNEDDAELLITIPFNGAVKIKAISIIGGSDGSSPARLKAYTNRHDLDFAAVTDMVPVQAWDLQEQQQASMEYPTQ